MLITMVANGLENYVVNNNAFYTIGTASVTGPAYYCTPPGGYFVTDPYVDTALNTAVLTKTWATTLTQSNTFSHQWRQEKEFAVQISSSIPAILVGETWKSWNKRYYQDLAARVVTLPPLPVSPVEAERPPPRVVTPPPPPPPPLPVSPIEAERQAARRAARSTLLSLLDGAQQAQLERERCFELRIDHRIYRVRPGNTVQQLDAKDPTKVLCSFCIHPYAEGWIPEDDWAIAQKLLLEADEKEFLRLANRRNYA
jgi:hypothetical protein